MSEFITPQNLMRLFVAVVFIGGCWFAYGQYKKMRAIKEHYRLRREAFDKEFAHLLEKPENDQ